MKNGEIRNAILPRFCHKISSKLLTWFTNSLLPLWLLEESAQGW